jgi:biotin-(acetyl-CoA carboxylase) ligase
MVVLGDEPTMPSLTLPPAYRLVRPEEVGDAHGCACRIAAEEGAGAFVWADRPDVLDFAVVLEPEEPLVSARRVVFAGMAAIADALASFAPPEKPITFVFPTTVRFDGGRLGGGRLAWPEGCAEDAVPDRLVFSGMLLAQPGPGADPGAHPDATWLTEEGFDPAELREVVASFARHLMVAFDGWAEGGFKAVADAYLARLPKEAGEGRRGIDQNGDLLLHREGGLERVPLLAGLLETAWRDPGTGLPRL